MDFQVITPVTGRTVFVGRENTFDEIVTLVAGMDQLKLGGAKGGHAVELWCGARRVGRGEAPRPGSVLRARVVDAVVGGKGGFGAMLRSLGKAGGAKPTTDFGACRDLSGRRLRHVNDEIALQRWHEARARNEARASPTSSSKGGKI